MNKASNRPSNHVPHSDDTAISFQKGSTYKEMGLLNEAISEYEKCLVDPAFRIRALREIGACYSAQNSPEKAERIFLRALLYPQISPHEKAKIHAELAEIYVHQSKLEAALERLLHLKDTDPDYLPDLEAKIKNLYDSLESTFWEEPNDTSGTGEVIHPYAGNNFEDARRSSPRVRFSSRILYSFDEANWNTGYSTDISKSGIFVLTYKPVPVGSLVFMKFEMPESFGPTPLKILGQTVRQESKKHSKNGVLGMGIQFISVDPNLSEKLKLLVQELQEREERDLASHKEIRFQCEHCGRVVGAEKSLSGKSITCFCGTELAVPFPTHNPTDDNPFRGYLLAGCRMDGVIGSGSAATVYKGHHLALDIPVAIKILSPMQKRIGSQIAKRFLTEARIIARIKHENIVAVMNAGEENGNNFIVMQYVAGRSLGQLLQSNDQIDLNQFIRFFLDVSAALQAAHEHDVVHGDIKPANILITPAGTAMLVDFGLVKDLKAFEEEKTKGLALGTPLYMSPEQAKGEYATEFRSDIYSLGATMYHALAGRPPFYGMTSLEVIRKQISEAPAHISDLVSDAPDRLADLIMKALEKDPARRFQSAEALRHELLKISRDVAIDRFKPLLKKRLKPPAEMD
jgi:tRNA A-37 threonylcarbamoyl transferase component Bud32/Tfp pilus assembly protein PilZ